MFRLMISLMAYYLYLILKYRKSLYMLQQNSYNVSNRYVKWTIKNIKQTLVTYDLLFILMVPLYYLIPLNFYYIFMILFYGLLFYMELKNIKKEQSKKPFVLTSRVKRLVVTIFILFMGMSLYIYFFKISNVAIICYLYYVLFAYLSFVVVYISNIINIPVEKCVFLHFKRQAVLKLNRMNHLIKIGITGSYGKTSTKNSLGLMLNEKYNAFVTPKSFNTTYGIINATNNYLDKFDDVYVAEMGACKIGDIKEICDLIKPKYGIITKIGLAHLETFKTIENTTKTKFELIESLSSDGVAVLNRDDINQVNYKINNSVSVIWIGIDNDADVMAKNIKMSSDGMEFDLVIKKDKINIRLCTPILGKANIYNILSSIAIAKLLNVSLEDIKKAVSMLKPTEHRLELKKLNDVIIIDDAFNSNPEGSKMALEVLKLMNGKKIVVTPGMIELGDKQYDLNKEFGKQISGVADEVILVGQKQTLPILDGLKENDYNKKNIHVINDVKIAFELVNKLKDKNTYVLLENDLPDSWTEV